MSNHPKTFKVTVVTGSVVLIRKFITSSLCLGMPGLVLSGVFPVLHFQDFFLFFSIVKGYAARVLVMSQAELFEFIQAKSSLGKLFYKKCSIVNESSLKFISIASAKTLLCTRKCIRLKCKKINFNVIKL